MEIIVLYPLYFSEMKKQIVRRNKSPKYRNRKNDLSSGFPEDILMRTRENISRGVKLVKCKNYYLMLRKRCLKEMPFNSIPTAIFTTASKRMQQHFFMTPVCNFRCQRKNAVKIGDIIYTFLAACLSIRYRHCSEFE